MDPPLVNKTLTVTYRTTNHGDPRLLCLPTQWTDVVVFFLLNYAAHAATVVTYPGESALSAVRAVAVALLFPASGVGRALNAIARHAKLQSTPLQMACRAGALCMVVRNDDWRPTAGLTVSSALWRGSLEVIVPGRQHRLGPFVLTTRKPVLRIDQQDMRGLDPIEVRLRLFRPLWSFPSHHLWTFFDHLQAVVPPDRNIHGSLLLTRGYSLAFVPQDAVVESATGQTKADASHTISATYSFPKALIAIAQIIFSAVTLVRASGAEIKHFGYAAFGLTVSPYIVMSLLNLCGNALNPTYPTLYVVGSDIMEEARARGSKIDGEVGTLVPDDIEMPGFTEYKVSGRSSNLEDLTPPSSPVSSRSQSRASGGRLGSESETQTGFQLAYGGTERYPDLFPPPIRRWNFTVTGPISASEALPSMARVLRPGLHVPKQAYHSAYRSETHSGPLDTEPKGKDLKVVIEWHTLHPTTPTLFIPTCSEFQRSNGHEWQMDLRHYIDASWTSDVEGHYERGGSSIARDGGFFPNQRASCKPVRLENVVRLLISSLPFAIIGGLSSFRAGAADGFTRFVVLSWLAIGTYFGANLGTVSVNMKRTFAATRATRMLWRCYSLFYIALWTAWTAMLFRAVVLQMLDWGTCTRLY